MKGGKVLQRLLDLPMPAVGVANEPATVHSEYLLLSDIHIASERATYGDSPHPAFGITGGDGLHVVWEEIAGTARAERLLWTGEQIDARTALAWGVVSEVVPHERAVDRGIQIARGLAARRGFTDGRGREMLRGRRDGPQGAGDPGGEDGRGSPSARSPKSGAITAPGGATASSATSTSVVSNSAAIDTAF